MAPRLFALVVTTAAGAAGCLGPSVGGAEWSGMNGAPAADRVQRGVLDVRIEALSEPRPERAAAGRNPFRFGDRAAGPRPAPVAAVERQVRARPRAASPPLRLIGVVDAPESAGPIAVLADGDGVFQGRVGDTVAGRYRIVRIAGDTVEVEQLVAGGQRMLRLDGLPESGTP